MIISGWQIWIIVAILLCIVEIFTPSFLAVCFALGCFVSSLFSFFDFGIKIQILAFSIGTVTSIFVVRPFMIKYAHKKTDRLRTNVDALVGKIGKVEVLIDNSKSQGRVKIEGDDWRAESIDNTIIMEGEKVEVIEINSIILIVKLKN